MMLVRDSHFNAVWNILATWTLNQIKFFLCKSHSLGLFLRPHENRIIHLVTKVRRILSFPSIYLCGLESWEGKTSFLTMNASRPLEEQRLYCENPVDKTPRTPKWSLMMTSSCGMAQSCLLSSALYLHVVEDPYNSCAQLHGTVWAGICFTHNQFRFSLRSPLCMQRIPRHLPKATLFRFQLLSLTHSLGYRKL